MNYRFEIKDEVIKELKSYAQYEGNELCGVLTGSQINELTFRICKVSPPCVAQNSRWGCERETSHANEFIRSDYEISGHTRVYVGEWHTHPEPNPTPSSTDVSSIIKNYNSTSRSVPFLMMFIVGTEFINCSIYTDRGFVSINQINSKDEDSTDGYKIIQ